MPEQVSRRTFLERSTALSVGAAAGLMSGSSLADTDKPRARIRKALKYDMVAGDAAELSVLDKFKLLVELGYDGVELYPGKMDQKEVIAARDESGLAVPGLVYAQSWKETLSSSDPEMRARSVEGLKKALHEAKAYGATSVLVIAAVVDEKTPYADAYKRSQEELHKAAATAEELGVVIALENVWNRFLLSPLEAARFVDELKSPMIRWHFDVGNVIFAGYPEHWIPVLGKRIFKLDIKEFSRKLMNDQGLWKGFGAEIGEGDVDWAAVMRELRAIEYVGWGSAEVAGGGRERLKEIAQRMDRVFAM